MIQSGNHHLMPMSTKFFDKRIYYIGYASLQTGDCLIGL